MKLQEIVAGPQEPVMGECLREYVDANLGEFKEVLANHPVKDNTGGISVCEAFWLYCLVRDLQPELVVESGTLYGFSLYFLAVAVPDAEMHSFDPGCDPKARLSGVEYYKCDWVECFPPKTSRGALWNSLVFFDDHVNQDVRLEQARERGVGHAVFHDNYLTLGHSHVPLRFSQLTDVELCYTFECLRGDPVFKDTRVNAQTYRWLTWVKFNEAGGAG